MDARTRRWAVGLLVAALGVASTGIAYAGISDGSYRPARQHCTGHADDSNNPAHTERGCMNLVTSVSDGNGHEAGYVGTLQTPDGTAVNQPVFGTGSGFDPTSGLRLYFGADDNLDKGEHDSSSLIGDGPSDGGAMVLDVDPASVQSFIDALQGADVSYLLSHPVPLLDAGAGSCADGICASVQTTKRTAYVGGNPAAPRDVADYSGKTWDPQTCAGPTDTPADCGTPNGIADWQAQNGTAYVEPGVQVYEDPNPEASPIGPYPLPALYVGPCGLIVGGGKLTFPATPLTNSAGQLAIKTGC